MTETLRYGTWPSPISMETLFAASAEPMHPFIHEGALYWLQSLADEGGRVALMTLRAGSARCLTPAPFNIRTQVHEYGGRCFCIAGQDIIFNSFGDGCLYRQALNMAADTMVAPELVFRSAEAVCGFADLVWISGTVIAVMEESVAGSENRNALVAVSPGNPTGSLTILAEGSDFYAAPAINESGNRIAWLEWDHPFMPWDQTRLLQAELDLAQTPRLVGRTVVLDAEEATLSQPGFVDNEALLFAMDNAEQDWSNLFVADSDGIRQLTHESGEFGEAHWVFGNRRWVAVAERQLLAVCTNHEGDRLLQVDLDGENDPVTLFQEASLGQLSAADGGCVLVASAEDRPPRIVAFDHPHGSPREPAIVAGRLIPDGYARPETLLCHTASGEEAWAYHYPPYHPDIQGPEGESPPLVVMVHGGPTARTSRAYHPLRQYFASLGFAVLDVNHRGSTGYGRRYRQRLLGGWGEVDVEDIACCVEQLVTDGRADPDRVFIRGGSAGGYAVLRALTRYPDTFAGGACYYGIGNLVTLAEITHKFESRYTDRLVGEPYDAERARRPESRFYQRSPVNELDRLRSPLILFQGEDDRVVPPAVSREVAGMLEKRGVPYAYHEYAGEGHGFRRQQTRIDSLEKETRFFRDIVLGKSPRESG